MKNIWIFTIAVIILIVFGAFLIKGSDTSGVKSVSGKTVASTGDVQVVKLSVVNGDYVLNPSQLKKGVTVRLEADLSKMPGCSKSIVIPAFNVRKSFSSGSNTVEFTPDKAGTFNIMCSMNMYRGTFTVLDDNGAKSDYVEQAPAASEGSCGTSGGGCGCGG